MMPRFSLRPLARQAKASILPSKAAISSTTRNAALQNLSSGARDMLGIDDSSSSNPESPDAFGSAQSNNPSRPMAAILEDRFDRHKRGLTSVNKTNIQEGQRLMNQKDMLVQQSPRRWLVGDVYSPYDLSIREMKQCRKSRPPAQDVFDLLGTNPLDHYKNFSMISEYMTDQGRIIGGKKSGLRPVNQRKIAKAIRRAIGMGIHPSTHKHPEILFDELSSGPRYQSSGPEKRERPKSFS